MNASPDSPFEAIRSRAQSCTERKPLGWRGGEVSIVVLRAIAFAW